ncbi:MAG: hypothetical protein BJ554DRAFT_4679, partial [Olpidium bornovanus]
LRQAGASGAPEVVAVPPDTARSGRFQGSTADYSPAPGVKAGVMPPIPTAPITSELERTSADGATEAAEGAVSKPRAPAPLQLGSGADKLPLLVSSAAELGRHRWNHDDDGDELSVSSSVSQQPDSPEQLTGEERQSRSAFAAC